MKRRRSLALWSGTPQFLYETTEDFIRSRVQSGIHTVMLGDQFLDLLIEDRKADVTLIVFHSAVGPSVETLPVFQGQGLAMVRGMNLIAISDPSLGFADIEIGWHIGNKDLGHLKPILSPLLVHIVDALGSSRNILYGASGGGFAAAAYGDAIPEAIVMVWNPRFDLGAAPKGAFSAYAFRAHGAGKAATQDRLMRRLMTDYGVLSQCKDGLTFDLLVFQNTGDQVFLEHQVAPVLEFFKHDPRLFVRMEFTEVGHRGVPSRIRKKMLDPLAHRSGLRTAISDAGFKPLESTAR